MTRKSSKSTSQHADPPTMAQETFLDVDGFGYFSAPEEPSEAVYGLLQDLQQLPDLDTRASTSRQHGVLLLVAYHLLQDATINDSKLEAVRGRTMEILFDLGKRAAHMQPDALTRVGWVSFMAYLKKHLT